MGAVDQVAADRARAVGLAPQLVGLAEEDARLLAEQHDCEVRVASRDGEAYMLTLDYVPSRLDVVVENGEVTAVLLRDD